MCEKDFRGTELSSKRSIISEAASSAQRLRNGFEAARSSPKSRRRGFGVMLVNAQLLGVALKQQYQAHSGFGEATSRHSGFEVASEQPFQAPCGFKVAPQQPFRAHSGFEVAQVASVCKIAVFPRRQVGTKLRKAPKTPKP